MSDLSPITSVRSSPGTNRAGLVGLLTYDLSPLGPRSVPSGTGLTINQLPTPVRLGADRERTCFTFDLWTLDLSLLDF